MVVKKLLYISVTDSVYVCVYIYAGSVLAILQSQTKFRLPQSYAENMCGMRGSGALWMEQDRRPD